MKRSLHLSQIPPIRIDVTIVEQLKGRHRARLTLSPVINTSTVGRNADGHVQNVRLPALVGDMEVRPFAGQGAMLIGLKRIGLIDALTALSARGAGASVVMPCGLGHQTSAPVASTCPAAPTSAPSLTSLSLHPPAAPVAMRGLRAPSPSALSMRLNAPAHGRPGLHRQLTEGRREAGCPAWARGQHPCKAREKNEGNRQVDAPQCFRLPVPRANPHIQPILRTRHGRISCRWWRSSAKGESSPHERAPDARLHSSISSQPVMAYQRQHSVRWGSCVVHTHCCVPLGKYRAARAHLTLAFGPVSGAGRPAFGPAACSGGVGGQRPSAARCLYPPPPPARRAPLLC